MKTLPVFAALEPALDRSPAVRAWLMLICAVILAMITIGGVTRLTGSGLSITDWKPIMGAIPPLTNEAWETVFAKYREIPQYKIINPAMDLPAFKVIYFWEWFHRLIGRLLGLVAVIPGIYFYLRGKISRKLAGRVLLGIALGGLQGALGWFMVKSGLTERTSVSHFRLAAHLGLALLILAYFVWIARAAFPTYSEVTPSRAGVFLRPKLKWLVLIFSFQITYGAFVAGLKAGYAFNTFPLMAGSFAPPNLWAFDPWITNLISNPATVQWIHRCLGWTALFLSVGLWIALRVKRVPRSESRIWMTAVAHMTIIQFLIGIATLLFSVPIALGSIHQFGAAVIVIFLTLLARSLKIEP